MDDSGARLLILSLLKQASFDAANKKQTHNKLSAQKFIQSTWCEQMCDGIGLDHNSYIEACRRNETSKRKYVTKEKSA